MYVIFSGWSAGGRGNPWCFLSLSTGKKIFLKKRADTKNWKVPLLAAKKNPELTQPVLNPTILHSEWQLKRVAIRIARLAFFWGGVLFARVAEPSCFLSPVFLCSSTSSRPPAPRMPFWTLNPWPAKIIAFCHSFISILHCVFFLLRKWFWQN